MTVRNISQLKITIEQRDRCIAACTRSVVRDPQIWCTDFVIAHRLLGYILCAISCSRSASWRATECCILMIWRRFDARDSQLIERASRSWWIGRSVFEERDRMQRWRYCSCCNYCNLKSWLSLITEIKISRECISSFQRLYRAFLMLKFIVETPDRPPKRQIDSGVSSLNFTRIFCRISARLNHRNQDIPWVYIKLSETI
jgi:hypothetical protein